MASAPVAVALGPAPPLLGSTPFFCFAGLGKSTLVIGHKYQRGLALSIAAALLSACNGSSTPSGSPPLPSTHGTSNALSSLNPEQKHRRHHRRHHRDIVACPFSIAANFNGTAIPSGRTLWFSAVAKAKGLGTHPVTI